MYNKKSIIDIYNEISDEKLDEQELLSILPKLYLILNKITLDNVEIVQVIDVLKEFKNLNKLDSINPETIDLIIKIAIIDDFALEGTLYFSLILKYTLLPFNKSIYQENYDSLFLISEFELYLELISKTITKKDLMIMDKYNHDLKEIIIHYKESERIYKKYVVNDILLDMMLSHFATMLYFNLEDFNYDYDILIDILYQIIDNYQGFIDYCCALKLHKNYTRLIVDSEMILKEYKASYDMLKFYYDNKNKGKIKRK